MGLWEFLVSIFWFMILFAWIWLLIVILMDIFRDHEMSGWGKGLWVLFIIVVPWLGAIVYLIARGGKMHERAAAEAARSEEAFKQYVKETAAAGGASSTADELAKLADLRDKGALSAEDFEKAKAKVLHDQPAPATGGNQQPASTT